MSPYALFESATVIFCLLIQTSNTPAELLLRYGGLLGLVVGAVGIYKFFIQRPSVRLIANERTNAGWLQDGAYKTMLEFQLTNEGRQYAENTILRVHNPDWNFGRRQSGSRIQVTMSAVGSDETETYGQAPVDEDVESGSSFEDAMNLSSPLIEVRNDTVYRIGGGEIHRFLVDDLVYTGDQFKLFSGTVIFEKNRSYKIEYEIGCRTYGPRTGKIVFHVGFDDMTIEHKHPRFLRAWAKGIVTIIRRGLGSIIQTLASWTDIRFAQKCAVQSGWIDKWEGEQQRLPEENGNFDASSSIELFLPVCKVKLWRLAGKLRIIDVKMTIITVSSEERDLFASITLSAYAISPGETWIARAPQEGMHSHRIDFTVEEGSNLQNPLPLRHLSEEEQNGHSPERTEVVWKARCRPVSMGDTRGIKWSQPEASTHIENRFEVTITNTNKTLRSPFVVLKMYDENGKVVATPVERVEIEGNDEETRYFSPNLIHDESTIVDTEIVLLAGI